jgi:hypothetical protein
MDEVLKKCIDEAKKNPKISLWSPKASAALRFLKKPLLSSRSAGRRQNFLKRL